MYPSLHPRQTSYSVSYTQFSCMSPHICIRCSSAWMVLPFFPTWGILSYQPKPQGLILYRALFDCPGSSSLLLWLPQNFCQTLTGILSLVPYVLTNVSPPMTCSRTRKGGLFVLIFSVPIPIFNWQQFHLTCRGHFSMSRNIFVVTVGERGGYRHLVGRRSTQQGIIQNVNIAEAERLWLMPEPGYSKQIGASIPASNNQELPFGWVLMVENSASTLGNPTGKSKQNQRSWNSMNFSMGKKNLRLLRSSVFCWSGVLKITHIWYRQDTWYGRKYKRAPFRRQVNFFFWWQSGEEAEENYQIYRSDWGVDLMAEWQNISESMLGGKCESRTCLKKQRLCCVEMFWAEYWENPCPVKRRLRLIMNDPSSKVGT